MKNEVKFLVIFLLLLFVVEKGVQLMLNRSNKNVNNSINNDSTE